MIAEQVQWEKFLTIILAQDFDLLPTHKEHYICVKCQMSPLDHISKSWGGKFQRHVLQYLPENGYHDQSTALHPHYM